MAKSWNDRLSEPSRTSSEGESQRGATADRALVVALRGTSKTSSSPPDMPPSMESDPAILQNWLVNARLFSEILSQLTPGQISVLRAFLWEPSDRRVARRLGLCYSTVRNHLSVIENKLNVASREHLIAMCMAAMVREFRNE